MVEIAKRSIVWALSMLGLLTLVAVMSVWINKPGDNPERRALRFIDRPAPIAAPLTEDRIIELPADSGIWHTLLFVHDGWQAHEDCRRLVAWFDTEPGLVSLKSQTKFWVYTESNPYYRQHFAGTLHALPAVRVQNAEGYLIYQASGRNIPRGPADLRRAITREVRAKCPGPYCFPDQRPAPDSVPPEPAPDVIPDSVAPAPEPEENAKEEDDNSIFTLLAALAGGGALGLKRS